MEQPNRFYAKELESLKKTHSELSKRKNHIAAGRIISFVLAIFFVIQAFSGNYILFAPLGLATFILFLTLIKIDSKLQKQKKQVEAQIECNEVELAYLNNDYSRLKQGSEYINPTHAYSFDLDIFGNRSIFQALNRTCTHKGEQMLVDSLLNICDSSDEISNKQKATSELSTDMKWCQRFLSTGKCNNPDKNGLDQLRKWVKEPVFFKKTSSRKYLLILNSSTIIAWIMAFLSAVPYGYPIALSLSQLAILAFYLKRINQFSEKLNSFNQEISSFQELTKLIETKDFSSKLLIEIKYDLFGMIQSHKSFSKLKNIITGFDQRNNIFIALILNGLYLKDLHHIFDSDNWKKRNTIHIENWISAIGKMDMLISQSIFRFNHPDYATPEYGETIIKASGMGHPLLDKEKMVTNDFEIQYLHNFYVITGANMAGKSTFLRSVGINLVLALSGNVVCCNRMLFCNMKLFTSMRTTDNLSTGTSYFHAELLRLKELVEKASQGDKLFIILDEMLKGTNSTDKQKGSEAFLKKLVDLPISGLVATHDLALGDLSENDPEHFSNICFEINHTENGISYDYKLRKGISQNMNATILLREMGLI